ncbi:MAG: DUF2752 domain-containing protein [Bacteroidetes bacterium]|nr:DUF2752 domain-containing protein [Bacteroidota bacterium]
MKYSFYIFYFLVLLSIPFVLFYLPSTFFDNGQTICLSVLLFDQTCIGCGMTRAVQHLIHFDFSTAFDYNKLSVIVFPVLIYLWIKEIKRIFIVLKKNRFD